MLNSDEFYVILCILHYAWTKAEYDRFLAYENGQPCLGYKDQPDFPNNVAKFSTEKEAIDAITEILGRETPENRHDRINLVMVRNNNKYNVARCKIEGDNIIVLSKTNIAELDRHW